MPSNPPTDKIDLFRLHRAEYASPKTPRIIETKSARYMAIDGAGSPGGETFQARLEALYGMAYTAKFMSKADGRDYTVSKLEAIYDQAAPDAASIGELPPEAWQWKFLIRVPDFIDDDALDRARAQLREKGKSGDFDDVRVVIIDQGVCVQMLHVGPYEEEGRTMEVMLAFAAEAGLVAHGGHHEIYISDPRRVAPEKLKTILRLPVRPRGDD
jgi:hypothetical protein